MKITSVTTSSVQALYLQTLLGSSSSSEDDATDSTVQDSSDILDLSSVAQWANRSQASNPFQTDFENLGTLISQGDLAGAGEERRGLPYGEKLPKRKNTQRHRKAKKGDATVTGHSGRSIIRMCQPVSARRRSATRPFRRTPLNATRNISAKTSGVRSA